MNNDPPKPKVLASAEETLEEEIMKAMTETQSLQLAETGWEINQRLAECWD